MELKQVFFVEKESYLRGSLKSHYINYALWMRVGLLTESAHYSC